MSYKPEVLVDNEWGRNQLVFATYDEALAYAKDLFHRWFLTKDFRAVEVDEPVNYVWDFATNTCARVEG